MCPTKIDEQATFAIFYANETTTAPIAYAHAPNEKWFDLREPTSRSRMQLPYLKQERKLKPFEY